MELYKLHIKHYHMSPAQFRRRTSMLGLSHSIYEKLKTCTTSVVCVVEGSLEVKLPTIWTDEKQSRAEAERRERLEERRVEEKESEERRCRCAKR